MKHWMMTFLAAVLPCIGAAQSIDLYCEIEGSSYVEELKKTHPAAGTLVYRIDASQRSIKNTAGLFAADPVSVINWADLQITAGQPYPQLTSIPGLNGFRIIRIDRTTGQFTIAHEVRNASNRALSQGEIDAEHAKANLPAHPLFMTRVGISLDGQCAPRNKLF